MSQLRVLCPVVWPPFLLARMAQRALPHRVAAAASGWDSAAARRALLRCGATAAVRHGAPAWRVLLSCAANTGQCGTAAWHALLTCGAASTVGRNDEAVGHTLPRHGAVTVAGHDGAAARNVLPRRMAAASAGQDSAVVTRALSHQGNDTVTSQDNAALRRALPHCWAVAAAGHDGTLVHHVFPHCVATADQDSIVPTAAAGQGGAVSQRTLPRHIYAAAGQDGAAVRRTFPISGALLQLARLVQRRGTLSPFLPPLSLTTVVQWCESLSLSLCFGAAAACEDDTATQRALIRDPPGVSAALVAPHHLLQGDYC